VPAAIIATVSPGGRAVWERVALAVPAWLPITINPRATVWAALVVILMVVAFVSARRLLDAANIRVFIRGISGIGIAVSAIGLAQDATSRGLMYWRRAPLQEGAPPFGPFVDRNSFATWALLAVPLCTGYLVAHTMAHHRRSLSVPRWSVRIQRALDARAIWLTASITLMLIALATTLSRSGMSSLAMAILFGAYLLGRRRRQSNLAVVWAGGLCAAALVLAVSRVDPVLLGRRFAASRTSVAHRMMIWRETVPIVRDFWLTGTGAGTYETAMLVYQQSSPGVRFNQAHNHYLQVAAEGGLLVGLPLALALGAFIRGALRQLRVDRTGMYWVRAGAACGLAGVAAQSFWETGLTAPANAIFAAIIAAIALFRHEIPAEPQR
jgi:O-antigen ligase